VSHCVVSGLLREHW